MNEFDLNPPRYGPGLLADLLAELLERFRHFSGLGEPAPGLVSHLARLKVSARLLASLPQVPGPSGEGFSRLDGVLSEWVARGESFPESLPPHVVFPLGLLADYLEELLDRRDRGLTGKELSQDSGWAGVCQSFRHAGTPLAVLDEVEVLLEKWGRRHSAANLTPVQAKRLQRRWLGLRSKGDALFHATVRPAVPPGESPEFSGASRRIFLLVDSSFRRQEIREKLADRNFQVEVASDPSAALELVVQGDEPAAFLCDHLEPTRHLVRLQQGLAGIPGGAKIPLVLVVGSSTARTDDTERARQLGADAAWKEPFDPVELSRILQRLWRP